MCVCMSNLSVCLIFVYEKVNFVCACDICVCAICMQAPTEPEDAGLQELEVQAVVSCQT